MRDFSSHIFCTVSVTSNLVRRQGWPWHQLQQQQQQHLHRSRRRHRTKRSESPIFADDAFKEYVFGDDDDDNTGPKAEAYKSNAEMPVFEHFPMKPESNVQDEVMEEEEEEGIEAAKMECLEEMERLQQQGQRGQQQQVIILESCGCVSTMQQFRKLCFISSLS